MCPLQAPAGARPGWAEMGWAAGLRMRAPVLHKVAGAPKAVTLVLPHEHWGTKGIKHLGLLLGELRASLPLLPHQQQDSQGSQGSIHCDHPSPDSPRF